jgi:Trypsin-like peptidase domain
MNCRFAYICSFLVLCATLGMAQSGCTTVSPCFCKKIESFNSNPPGECDIQQNYKELLGIAINNWGKIKDLDFIFAPIIPYIKSKPDKKYGRCPAENTEPQPRQYAGNDSAMGFRLADATVSELRNALAGIADPLPIETPSIRLDENQQYDPDYNGFVEKEASGLAYLGELVGRLELRYQQPTQPAKYDCAAPPCQEHLENSSGKISYAQWGTAVQVADDVIVTSCHELESLVEKKDGTWKLKKMEPSEDLYVDFGERDDQYDHGNEFKVTEILWLPEDEGVDVAALKIEPQCALPDKKLCPPRPSPMLFKFGDAPTSDPEHKHEVAVIGYPDFHHPLDPCAEASFGPYKTQGDAKFVSLGCAQDRSDMPNCKAYPKGTLLHSATTTMGESGGIVVDRDKKMIIGMHVCCSYPQDKTYGTPPTSELSCARLKNEQTQDNQAISACALANGMAKDVNGRRFRDVVPVSSWNCSEANAATGATKGTVQKH